MTTTYTSFGAAATRTDARGVVTRYAYDALHRLVEVSHDTSAAPDVVPTAAVSFTYGTDPAANTNGRLVSLTDAVGTETTSYDVLGRVSAVERRFGTESSTTRYAYDRLGQLTELVYPCGRTVSYRYDAVGRLTGVDSDGRPYLTDIAYDAAGLPVRVDYGNGVTTTTSYTERLQLDTVRTVASDGSDVLHLDYDYGDPVTGQIAAVTDHLDPSRSQRYSYDAWGRLETATAGADPLPAWSLGWRYDRYGNRLEQRLLAGSGPTWSQSVDPATNRIASYTYDAAGSVTADLAGRSYGYDANGRLASVDGGATASYTYAADGLKVETHLPGLPVRRTHTSGTQPLCETAGAWLHRDLLYAGDVPIASHTGFGPASFHHRDHLSVRASTGAGGTAIGEQGHYPFGERWYVDERATHATTPWAFTSYEREGESGLDYAVFRRYGSRSGTFLTPDPLLGRPGAPATHNRYAYALGDPIGLVDPLGLETPQVSMCYLSEEGEVEACLGPPVTVVVTPAGASFLFGNFVVGSLRRPALGEGAYWFGPGGLRGGFGLRDAALVGGAVAAGFIPGVGEALDVAVLLDPSSTAVDRAFAAVSLAANTFVPVLPNFGAGVRAAGEMTAAARQLGRAGEAAVRAAHDIGPSRAITVGGRKRIPDGVNVGAKTISEVKNVRSLSYTGQLRDYAAFAQQEGFAFNLYVRTGAQLSQPLLAARAAGHVSILEIPF